MDNQNQGLGKGEGADPLPSDLLRRLRLAAARLERYSLQVKDAMATGDRDRLVQALADVAEAHEIARRLSKALVDFLAQTSS